jgi:hypothetical protein
VRPTDPDRYGKGQRNGAWLGKPTAGLRLLFKDNDPAWDSPIEMPDEPPVGWANCKTSGHCIGNVSVVGRNGTVTLESFTGQSTAVSQHDINSVCVSFSLIVCLTL